MTGKEELLHLQDLKDRIEEQKYYIEQLRAWDGLSGISYDKEKIQTSPDGDIMVEHFEKVQSAEQKLKNLNTLYIGWWSAVLDRIHRMPVGDLQKILYKIYIEGHSIKDTAVIMCWSYDHCRKQHVRAVELYEKTL